MKEIGRTTGQQHNERMLTKLWSVFLGPNTGGLCRRLHQRWRQGRVASQTSEFIIVIGGFDFERSYLDIGKEGSCKGFYQKTRKMN